MKLKRFRAILKKRLLIGLLLVVIIPIQFLIEKTAIVLNGIINVLDRWVQ